MYAALDPYFISDQVPAYMNLNKLYLQALEYLYSIKGITLFTVYANVYDGRNASKMKDEKKLCQC